MYTIPVFVAHEVMSSDPMAQAQPCRSPACHNTLAFVGIRLLGTLDPFRPSTSGSFLRTSVELLRRSRSLDPCSFARAPTILTLAFPWPELRYPFL